MSDTRQISQLNMAVERAVQLSANLTEVLGLAISSKRNTSPRAKKRTDKDL